ncbi:glutaredoxin 3 [Colwelliaceae bacterium 6471]
MTKIDIYTKATCPYCMRAKALLEFKQVSYREIKVDHDTELRSEMITRSNGGYTVPQIFIDDHHVGGCDELYALHAKDQLDELLEVCQ